MFVGAAKAAYRMYESGSLGGEKPRSSVSALMDILCLDKYAEDDYEGIPELVESINLQPTGPTEASRAIRKKLKYSSVHGQVRALTILNALVENCGTRFQSTFANERLVDRIKVLAGDPHTDPAVKKKLMRVLAGWHREFNDDPKMQLVAGLYKSCGGGKTVVSRSAATEAYEQQQARYDREAAARAERKAAAQRAKEAEKERIAKEKADKAQRKQQQTTRTRRPPFNFEQEKPKIMASVGQGAQSAQALINALQLVNREKESVTTNARVQECLEKAKTDRKAIVRYIQLVDTDESGDYIGTLLATNEQIINAVQLYDRMSKPVDLDSDDEAIEQAKALAKQQGLSVPAGPNDADDTQSIRSRLSAFDMQDREVDKLQMRQRRRLDRHLSARGAAPLVHPDLQDLAFGSTGASSSSLPPPIQPRSAEDTYRHGSLSDYSDYDSSSDASDGYSSDEGVPIPSSRAPTSASSSAGNALPHSNARSYAQYIQEDDQRLGRGKGLLHEEPAANDEDDPFADPDDGASAYEVMTPGIPDKRIEWKEI
ncbi:hypothetical protein JCM1840_004877 [Sporobolomyces johnsonii]